MSNERVFEVDLGDSGQTIHRIETEDLGEYFEQEVLAGLGDIDRVQRLAMMIMSDLYSLYVTVQKFAQSVDALDPRIKSDYLDFVERLQYAISDDFDWESLFTVTEDGIVMTDFHVSNADECNERLEARRREELLSLLEHVDVEDIKDVMETLTEFIES